MQTMELRLSPVLRPTEVAELVRDRSNMRLLDVRTPGEYEALHMSGAYNVPLDTLGEHAREIGANVAEPTVLVCQSGQRARKAEEVLRVAGLSNLHVLEGGVNGWLAAGLPVERGPEKLSLERQVRIAAGALAAAGGLLGALVNPMFALLAAFVGVGLVFAGLTNSCGMAMVLARLPYNRPVTSDVAAMVRALSSGRDPASSGRAPLTFARLPRTCAN